MSLGDVQVYTGLGSSSIEDFSGSWYTTFVSNLLADFEKFQQDVIDNVGYGADLSNYALITYVDQGIADLGTGLTSYIDQSIEEINLGQDFSELTGRVTALETEIDGGTFP